MNKETYQSLVNRAAPKSPIWKDVANAFWVGGLICVVGQIITQFALKSGLDKTSAGAVTSIILVGASAFFTGLTLYPKLAKFAGAGTIVPITGFANAMVSPAIEYHSEGYVLGIGAKMFTVAGPVLVYGTISSMIAGLIYCLMGGAGGGI